jgi:hypothetical protein
MKLLSCFVSYVPFVLSCDFLALFKNGNAISMVYRDITLSAMPADGIQVLPTSDLSSL